MTVVSAGTETDDGVELTGKGPARKAKVPREGEISAREGKVVMQPQPLPLWVRSFIVDFVETGLAALLALTLIVPTNVEQGKEVALLVGAAVAGALISAVRRAVPGFLSWLNEKLGTKA